MEAADQGEGADNSTTEGKVVEEKFVAPANAEVGQLHSSAYPSTPSLLTWQLSHSHPAPSTVQVLPSVPR